MKVFLIGGGWSREHAPAVFGGFVDAGRSRAGGGEPRVLLVLMGVDEESVAYHEKYLDVLRSVGVPAPVVSRVAEGEPFDPAALNAVDGLLVGGGPTPEYHASLAPSYARIRELVADGLPYAGFSAGSAIAATTAIVGGWRIDGVPVCPEDSNEDLDEVTVVDGLGLVPGAVDVHAAQWGNLSRLVAATEAGLVPGGVAVDESTVLLPDGTVGGAGRVWRVTTGPGGPTVSRS